MEDNQSRHDVSRMNSITTTATDGASESIGQSTMGAGTARIPANWDLEADVVIIGSGAAGLPAAIKAADRERR